MSNMDPSYRDWKAEIEAEIIKYPQRMPHAMPFMPMDITIMELAPSQARAYALIAASGMCGIAGNHPNPSDIQDWEKAVIAMAKRFEHYINGTTEESEDS